MKRQQELPGTERPSIDEIDECAAHYVEVRDERMLMTKREVAARQTLAAVMHEHADVLEKTEDDDLVYSFVDGEDQLTVIVSSREAIKVQRASLEPRDDDE